MNTLTVGLNNEAVSLIQIENYTDAMSCLNKALLVSSKINARSSFSSIISFTSNYIDTNGSIGAESSANNTISAFDSSNIAQHEFEGECDEGMRTFSEPLIIDLAGGCDPIDQIVVDAMVYYNLGIICIRLGQDDEAYPYFNKSLSLKHSYSSYLHKTHFPYLDVAALHNMGHINYRVCNFQDAFCSYQRALKMAQNLGLASNIYVALTLNCIGIARMEMTQGSEEKKMKSLDNFSEALSISLDFDEDCLGDLDIRCLRKLRATFMNNIGRINVLQGNITEALPMYRKAHRIRKQLIGEDHLNTVAINFNLAEALHLSGDTDRALQMLHKFLTVASSLLGHQGQDRVAVLLMFAEAHSKTNDRKKAAEFYSKALKLLKVESPRNNAEIAELLNTLGNLFYEIGDRSSALESYKEGLQLEREMFELDDPKIIVTVHNIARIYHHNNDLKSALKMYNEGADIQRSICSANPMEMACTLENIGKVNSQLGNAETSIKAYIEALMIKKAALGPKHYEVSTILNTMGLVFFREGASRYEDALRCFGESFSIRCQNRSASRRSISAVVFNIATVYFELQKFEKALESFQECLAIERSSSDPSNYDIASTLKRIGGVYHKIDCPQNTLHYYEKALSLYKLDPALSTRHNDIADLHSSIGNIQRRVGKSKEAERSIKKARAYTRTANCRDC